MSGDLQVARSGGALGSRLGWSAPSLPDLVSGQCGVVTCGQLGRLVSADHVRAQLDAERWQRPHRGVVVVHNGPLTAEQELWVAVLAGPPGTVLAGPTAACLGGLRGFESDLIHVLVPAKARTFQHDGVEVGRSRCLESFDVHPSATPPRTRLQRSLLDIASARSTPDHRTRAVLLAGVQQRLTTVALLQEALTRRGRCRRRALILETLDDAAGGIASVPEREFALLVRQHRLPEPTRQVLRRRRTGVYYLDSWWDDYQLGSEVQGVPHFALDQWDADLDRHNEITADGASVLHFSSFAIRHRALKIAQVLAKALRSRGWPG